MYRLTVSPVATDSLTDIEEKKKSESITDVLLHQEIPCSANRTRPIGLLEAERKEL